MKWESDIYKELLIICIMIKCIRKYVIYDLKKGKQNWSSCIRDVCEKINDTKLKFFYKINNLQII